MSWILKYLPIEAIFSFLNAWVASTIKNPQSVNAQQLKPFVKELNVLSGQLLQILG